MRPIDDSVSGSVGVPIDLSALNINCANPNGNVNVSVNPGGEIVTLVDDGLGSDQAAGDGIYWGEWTPSNTGNFTLEFPDGSIVTVSIAAPIISVTPNSLDFGSVNSGVSIDKTFTVQNAGAGTLIGNATTSSPYSIISRASYSLSSGQSQTITVRFSPTSAGAFTGNVSFTGGNEASRSVTGIGLPPATLVTSPNSVPLGGTITATWNGIAAPTAKDWIGLYAPGAPQGPSSPSLAWRYTTGSASGNVPFVIPATLAPGTYELRLFANDGYTRLATSNAFVVTSSVALNRSLKQRQSFRQ